MKGREILVVGAPGSGKSTFAQGLAEKLELPHFELDDFVWDAGWEEVSDEELSSRVGGLFAENSNGLVLDGVLTSKLSAEVLDSFTDIIYLDVPFSVSFPRAMKRNFARLKSHEQICGENHEVPLTFLASASGMVFKHILRKHRFRSLLDRSEEEGAFHFRSNEEANTWLEQL